MRDARGENRSRGRKYTLILNSSLFPSISITTSPASEAKIPHLQASLNGVSDMEIIRSGYLPRIPHADRFPGATSA